MKKKNKFIFLATLSTACLLSLASCQGAQGPKGDQGEPGINGTNGTNGKNGEDGEDGNSVRTGKGVPASSLGKDGDSYIDTESFDFYVKSNGAWTKEGNIKGASGDAGSQGEAGTKGEDGTSIRNGKGVPADTLGNDGDCYIDLSTFDFYVKSEGKWSKEGNIKGEKGEQGEKGDKGTPGSNGSQGAAGADGKTAWGNTILPATNGYVTVDRGSQIEGEDVTFTFCPDPKFELKTLIINGSDTYSVDNKTYLEKVNNNKLTIPMVKNGFVVQATFTKDSQYTEAVEDSSTNKYESVNDALKTITGNTKSIKLLKDTTLLDDITIASGDTVTIDLNGYKLYSNGKTIYVKGTLNLNTKDNSEATNAYEGKIEVDGSGQTGPASRSNKGSFGGVSVLSNSGLRTYGDVSNATPTLVIGKGVNVVSTTTDPAIKVADASAKITVAEGATIENKNESATAKAIEVTAGTVSIAGIVKSENGVAVEVKQSSSGNTASVTVDGSNASVEGGAKALSVSAGTVNITSGTVKSENGVAVDVAKTDSNTETSVTVSANATVSTTSGTAVEVKGGTVEVSGKITSETGTAVKVTKDESTLSEDVSSSVTVNTGATVSGAKAVEVTAGSIEVKGGTVSATDGAAVEVTGGSVKVSGGTVETSSTTESAIAVVQQAKNDGAEGTKVEVTAGTISSNGQSAISVKKDENTQTAAQTVEVKLDGGSYSTNSDKPAVSQEEGSTSVTVDVKEEAIKYSIKAESVIDGTGTVTVTNSQGSTLTEASANTEVTIKFTPVEGNTIKSVLVNGVESVTDEVRSNNSLNVKMTTSGLTVKVKYVNSTLLDSVEGSDNKKYETVDEAFEAGCSSVTLLKDSVCNKDLNIDAKSFEINLGDGKKLDFATGKTIKVSNGATFKTSGQGTINGKFETNEATTPEDNRSNHYFLTVANSTNSNKNTVTISENTSVNVTNSDNQYCSFIKVALGTDSQKTLSEVNLNGSVSVSMGFACTVNGLITSTTNAVTDNVVNVGEKANLNGGKSTALYQAGFSTFNVKGGTIAGGEAAMEVRAGNSNITGGTFKCTATEEEYVANGSGTTSTGAALAVVQHSTKENINVTVSAGTFTGFKGLFAADLQNNGADAIAKVKITLNGGTFTGNKLDIDVKNDISCEIGTGVTYGTDKSSGINGKALVSSQEELEQALAASKITEIKLNGDIDVSKMIKISKSITLDLNGHKLFNTTDLWGDNSNCILSIIGSINVTLKDSSTTQTGIIDAKKDDCYCIDIKNGANVTIESGTYSGNVSAVQVNKGSLTITGGVFNLKQLWKNAYTYEINCIDANYKDGSAKVSIKGGTFIGFDPSKAPEGDNISFLASDYKSVEETEGNVKKYVVKSSN